MDEAARVLAGAFRDYPWTRWTVDEDDHLERLVELQRISLRRDGLERGHVWVTETSGHIRSVAIWTDSSTPPGPAGHNDATATLRRLQGNRDEAAVRADAEIPDWAPPERHLFLGAVGTEATRRRQGLARRTLEPGLRLADQDGIPCFLETSTTTNVGFYRALGFDVVGHITIAGGGPDVWAMHRVPDANAGAG